MIGETGERKSAVATPDGKSRKKKKKKISQDLNWTQLFCFHKNWNVYTYFLFLHENCEFRIGRLYTDHVVKIGRHGCSLAVPEGTVLPISHCHLSLFSTLHKYLLLL